MAVGAYVSGASSAAQSVHHANPAGLHFRNDTRTLSRSGVASSGGCGLIYRALITDGWQRVRADQGLASLEFAAPVLLGKSLQIQQHLFGDI